MAAAEGFRFVSFKEQSEDSRKITRKHHLLNVGAKELYPPEFHVYFAGAFSEDSSEDNDGDEDSTLSTTAGKIFYLGGGRNAEESSWNFASTLYYYQVNHTENDVWIDESGTVKMHGASMPCLSRATCIDLGVNKDNQKGNYYGVV